MLLKPQRQAWEQYLARLIGRSTRSVRWSVLGTVLMGAAIAGLAVVDAEASGVSLAVLYVIPALAGAVLLGAGPGLVLAVAGSVAWAWAEPAPRTPPPAAFHDLDAAIRMLAVAAAVVMIDVLRRALRTALDSDQRARNFLGLAAHQLRTPVASLRASAETLVTLGATPEQEPFLADIAAEAARIGRLVANLLWVARQDAGVGYEARPCRPVAACAEEAERVQRRLLGLSVHVDEEGEDHLVEVAERVLRDTVANLLDNAARHALAKIDLTVRVSAGQVTVRVSDDGPGVEPSLREEIFGRFVSFDGGTGLGLALCREAARQVGGDLAYRQRGFELRLPCRAPAPSDIDPAR